MATTSKTTWKNEAGYIWSMIGSAVGFANVLSFSALCYKNGGGAFLIPYIIAHLLVGIPMLFLEGIVGQKTKLPIVSAMGQAAGSFGKAFGWLAVLTVATIGGFYMVLTGFSVAYTYFSATGMIGADSTHFFKHVFLHDSGSLHQFGGLAGGVFVSALLVAIFSWAVMMRNIQSGVERLCTIFLPLLALLVTLFTCAAFFLPGASIGIKNYLIPDFHRLANWTLWRDVFGQVFFSLSLGIGIVTGYSRHNQKSFSISRAMVKVALGDFMISFICGFAVFACIGFMSAKTGTPFSQLVTSDSAFEIGFVIFPMILSHFGALLSKIIGPLFFFCVFIAGVTGVFSIVESVAGNIEVEFRKSRKWAVGFAMALVTALAFPFCLGNGQHLLGSIAPMVLGNTMLMGGIAEIIIFLFISKTISGDALWMKQGKRTYPYYALKYVVLPLLTFGLSGALVSEFSHFTFSLGEMIRWGWLLVVLVVCYVLANKPAHAGKVAEALES
jgi:NSS family neurotransmitter:Na+ symporter